MREEIRERLEIILPAKIRLLLIIMVTIILVTLSIFFLRTLENPQLIENKIIKYQYMQKANIGYEVSLKPNMLYSEKKLGMGHIYPSNFVDQLQTTFSYQYRGDKKADIKGKYCVIATVQGEQIEEKKVKVLWSKDFLLIPETSFNSTEDSVEFKQEVPINYGTFNKFAEEVQKATEISSQVKLSINWKVNIEAKTNDGMIKEELTPKITLPLGKKYFEVEGELTKEKTGAMENKVWTKDPVNKSGIVLLGIFGLLCMLALLYLVLFVKGFTESLFEKKVKQIFKNHGERLVALEQTPIVNKEMLIKVIKVKTLEDLVRIADETCKPVYYNVKAIEQRKIVPFYVLGEERIFAYYLIPPDNEKIMERKDSEAEPCKNKC